MSETATAPTPNEIARERTYGTLHRHIVTFDAPITTDQFRAWLEARGWLGYHPAGYQGSYEVRDNVGVYKHWHTCD